MALFEPIFETLNASGSRYVVVGGVAVVLHGHARLTADLDVAVDLAPEAARAVIEALLASGLRPRAHVDAADFADSSIRRRWLDEQGMRVFSLWDPDDPLRSVDLFVESPVDFEELYARSNEIDVGGISVRIASIPDLIDMKRRAGRPQDLDDIEALRVIEERDGLGDG